MPVVRSHTYPLQTDDQIVAARRAVREWAIALKFSLVDQTKLVTAVSELARNAILHGGGGQMHLEELREGIRTGLAATFQDDGAGIPDVELALKDGYTTGGGLGLGLGGAKRLVNEFEIQSAPSQGTRIRIIRWK